MSATTETKESKFRMILVAARRARQIQAGARPLIHTTARKSTRIAQEEMRAGVLPYEILPTPSPGGSEKEGAPALRSKR